MCNVYIQAVGTLLKIKFKNKNRYRSYRVESSG